MGFPKLVGGSPTGKTTHVKKKKQKITARCKYDEDSNTRPAPGGVLGGSPEGTQGDVHK